METRKKWKAEEKDKNELAQYIIVQLANEEYGIPIIYVERLDRIPDITRIPGMPDFVEGVINLRSQIIPIIDLRKKLGLAEKKWDNKTRIVVTEIDGQRVGHVVDGVSEVIKISHDAIGPIPSTISQIGNEYLSGVGKLEGRLVILLDLEKVLSEIEKKALQKITTKITE